MWSVYEHSSCPPTSLADENMEKVHKIVSEDQGSIIFEIISRWTFHVEYASKF